MWSRRCDRPLPAALIALTLPAACGGCAGENRARVRRFPELPGTDLVSTESHDHCENDTCPLGPDGTGTLLPGFEIFVDAHGGGRSTE